MSDPTRRTNLGGRQGRGDPFATWREEDEAKDPASRRLVAWFFIAYLTALAIVAAAYLWP